MKYAYVLISATFLPSMMLVMRILRKTLEKLAQLLVWSAGQLGGTKILNTSTEYGGTFCGQIPQNYVTTVLGLKVSKKLVFLISNTYT
jgi:hypothetical protein